MATERVEFPSSSGVHLAGRLECPDEPRATAIFAHCFTCSKESAAASRVARQLTEVGIAVLRFDFTGLGGSDGDFSNTDFSSNVDDIAAAADFLSERIAAPAILIGHSLGGAAVLAAAEKLPSVQAVATIGAPAEPGHVVKLLGDATSTISAEGSAVVELGGREFCVRKAFLEDITEQAQRERIRALKAALLVMHSPVDDVVGVDNARLIFDAATHPKSFVALDQANHFITDARDTEYVATMIAAFASRYVEEAVPRDAVIPAPATQDTAQPAAGEPGVVTVETGQGRFGQCITAGTHTFIADEPRDIGDDTGPNPYDFLLSALGTCTSMTLQEFARRKGWPLEAVHVRLQHARTHWSDCDTCEEQSAKIDRIDKVITLTGDLTQEQRTKLLQVADQCPVHKTLHNQIDIPTVLD